MWRKFDLYRFIILAGFYCVNFISKAQISNNNDTVSYDSIVITDLIIEGNHKTKAYIFEKELFYMKNQKIAVKDTNYFDTLIQNQLFNTGLFLFVKSKIKMIDLLQGHFNIQVKERWYFFPLPYLKFIDRNLSTFLIENKADLTRLNYGLKLSYYNISGRNDKLFLWLVTGYNNIIAARYQIPFIHKKSNLGLSFEYKYANQKELNIKTISNQQYFYQTTTNAVNYISQNYTFTLFKRQGFFSNHNYSLQFSFNQISDSALAFNSSYFPNKARKYAYSEIQHQYTFNRLNYYVFPEQGYSLKFISSLRFSDNVLPLLQFQFQSTFATQPSHNTIYTLQTWAKIKALANEAYFTQGLIGYNDNQPRGLEYYVIDGLRGFTIKNTYYLKLFGLKMKSMIHAKKLKNIQFKFYGHVFSDFGFANNDFIFLSNSLTNQFLYTAGAGIDLLSIYDFLLNIDYSFNQLGKNGVYLRFSIGF